MRTFIILVFISLFYGQNLTAQTFPSFYQYGPFQGYANPAMPFKGYNGHHNLSAQISHRAQSLNGLSDVPFNQVFQLDWMPRKGAQFHPYLGLNVAKRQFGPTRYTNLFFKLGAINYTSPSLGVLSAAFNVGINSFGIRAAETNGLAPNDNLLNGTHSTSMPNVGFGLYYESPTFSKQYKLYVGLSVPQVFAFNLVTTSVNDWVDAAPREMQPMYSGVIGTKIYTGAFSYFDISAWLTKEEGNDLSGDLLARYHLEQPAMWFGAGVSSTQNYRVEWGMHFNYLRKTNRGVYQNKGQNLRLNLAYNFSSNAVPSQLNHGVELNFAWLIATQ